MEQQELQEAFERAASQLKNALLSGTPWEEVQEHRFQVTTLEIALHRYRRNTGGDPSQSPRRSR